jgi:hypothetical protein
MIRISEEGNAFFPSKTAYSKYYFAKNVAE